MMLARKLPASGGAATGAKRCARARSRLQVSHASETSSRQEAAPAAELQTAAVTDRRQLLSLAAAACLYPALCNVQDVSAEEVVEAATSSAAVSSSNTRVYLDVKIEGEPIGRCARHWPN